MGLIANGFRDSGGLYLTSGATAFNNAYPSAQHANMALAGSLRNQLFGEGITDDLAGVPNGYRNGGATVMPQKAGGLSSHSNVQLGFSVTPDDLIPALNAVSSIDWNIIVNQAALALTVGGVSSISFNLDITPAPNLSGSLSGTASIPFDITMTSFLGAVNGAGASIGWSISPAGSTLTAKGSIAANITSEGEAVTPTSVAAAVWSAVAAAYNMAGTTGAALNAAGSAGDPWITNLPGSYISGSAGNIIGNLLANSNAHTDTAVAGIDTTSLKYAIESLRPDHQGFGTAYFWDIINGSDANDGLTPTTPKSSWAAVEALTADGAGDTIYVLPDPGSTQITITERISITKKSLNLRGPGRTVKFKPDSGTGDTITIGATNVSIKGFVIEGATNDITGSSILINDKFARIEDCWINRHGYGIRCRAGDYHFFVNNTLEYHAINGMHFDDAGFATPGSPREAYIANNTIYFNTQDGIHFADTTGNSTRLNILLNNRVHHNGRYGIYIGAAVARTMVHATNYIKDNGTVTIDPVTKVVTPAGDPDPANEVYTNPLAGDPMIDNMADTMPTAIGSRVIEGTLTQDQLVRIMAAALAGKVSGAGTGTEVFRNASDTKNVITATIDSSGNRTAITLDGL